MKGIPAQQPDIDILREIRQVFEIEIEALRSVADNLPENIEQAVRAMAACRGRVVFTGIGKSGIIANKIAATLTSTGTPATFMHASEGLHGDVGVIRADDIVVAVGKSGETDDLNILLPVIRKIGSLIIAITANPTSKMAGLSDIVLSLRIPREACPLNLAPTSSTTATLVVGDAIAVALMKLKDVSSSDFAARHPAGQLGKRLLLEVQDVMRTGERNPVIHIREDVKQMIILITKGQAGAISIINDANELVGFVSDYDIRMALEKTKNIFDLQIEDLMNANPTFIYADQKANEALELMQARKKPTAVLPVLDRDRRVVGMLHAMDLVSAGL